MPEARVVLVGPKNEGNVGAVARAMKNFGVSQLVLVAPCPIGDDAYKRAMHGADVLANAKTVESIEEAVRDADLVAGSTGIASQGEKRFLLIALTPRVFGTRVAVMDGMLAIVLGRGEFALLW